MQRFYRRDMLSKRTENILVSLARIEAAVAKVYEYFSKNTGYTVAAREFWESAMKEEHEHEKFFKLILLKANTDDTIQIEVNFDAALLNKTVKDFKRILKAVSKEEISESRAYEVGFLIEERLYEFGFVKRIITENEPIIRLINKVMDETKRHRLMLHNFSLGQRSPLRPSTGPAVPVAKSESL